jgi:GeoRSP system PqqD family protein
MSKTWELHAPVLRHPNAVWRGFGEEMAVLDPGLGRLSSFNVVAARVWQLADGRTFEALIDQLLNEFEVERNQLEPDVRTFLDELSQRGLLAD